MTIHPLTKRSPIDIASTRVEASNTFSAERFVALTASGWALADNTDGAKHAVGWIAASDPDSFRVVVAHGEIVEWSSHGFGAAETELWLDTSGQVVTSKPSGVQVVQKVGKVLDADHVQLFPDGGFDESDFVLLSGRAGGQTILLGLTLEGGVTINDLGEDVDFRVEGDTEENLLFVDASTGRVCVGSDTPGRRFEIVSGGTADLGVRSTVNAAALLELSHSLQAWRFQVQPTTGDFFFFDATNVKRAFRVVANSPSDSLRIEPSGVALFGSGSFGGATGVVFIGDRTTAPGSNPAGGALLYAESGDLKKRTSGGTDSKLLSEAEGDARYEPEKPSGFTMLAESVPTGYQRDDVADGMLIKLAESGDTLGAEGGGDDPFDGNWQTQGHVLTVSQLASHSHGPDGGNSSDAWFTRVDGGNQQLTTESGSAFISSETQTASAGSNAAHSHALTTPNFRVMGRIVKQ